MSSAVIITLCGLLLFAYVFDLTSSKTRIPSVILLLLLGWAVRQTTVFFGIELPSFTQILPALGTIGLILIVLDGALELELDRSKTGLILKTFLGATIPILLLSFLLGFLFHYYSGYGLKQCFTNAVPLCVISSAVAIPSVKNLSPKLREFVIYESSFSDIIGVLVFNFVAFNVFIDAHAFGSFGLQILVMAAISFVATIGLSLLLSKIRHQIKFIPIILLIIIIYVVSKEFHLPSLIFILILGIFIGNIENIQFSWIRYFKPEILSREVTRFHEITVEVAFLVRALFFLLFGYLIETAEVLNPSTFIWAVIVVLVVLLVRASQLLLSRQPLLPLLFIAPRGLITILLFISIPASSQIDLVNTSLITQVIILLALVMMVGLMITKSESKTTEPQSQAEQSDGDENEIGESIKADY